MLNNKDKNPNLVNISIKGAIIIFAALGFINLILVSLLEKMGMSQSLSIIILNTVFSSAIISYVVTYIDNNQRSSKKFINRYIKFALLFLVITYMWSRNVFI